MSKIFEFDKVTRVTVVTDEQGRVYEGYDIYQHGVEIHLQDDGRTLKLFPAPAPPKAEVSDLMKALRESLEARRGQVPTQSVTTEAVKDAFMEIPWTNPQRAAEDFVKWLERIKWEAYGRGYNQGHDDVYNPRTLDEEE